MTYMTGKTSEAIYAFAEPLTAEAFQDMIHKAMADPWNVKRLKKRKTYHEVKAKQRRRKNGVRKP